MYNRKVFILCYKCTTGGGECLYCVINVQQEGGECLYCVINVQQEGGECLYCVINVQQEVNVNTVLKM